MRNVTWMSRFSSILASAKTALGQRLMRATNKKELAAELGDLFFALVNLARWKKMDAESVLRETNKKFKKRFGL